MMKLRNGNSVEVLRREHDRCGSWFPGTILSGCGNHYVVKYKFFMDQKGEPVMEKVHGEDVRPQPLREMGKRWVVGDIAEVFDSQCWRLGKVAKVLRKNWFAIRLFGSIQLKEFHESNIRVRRAWHNNEWSVIQKIASGKQFTALKNSKFSSDPFSRVLSQQIGKNSNSRERDRQECHESGHDHSDKCRSVRTVFRSQACQFETTSNNLPIGGSHRNPQAGGFNRPPMGTLPFSEQVADIPSPKVRMDEQFIFGSTEMDAKMVNATIDPLHVSSMPHRSDEDSNECSIASCSSNDFTDFHQKSLEDISNNSDADSSFPTLSGKKHLIPSPRHKLDVDIHELELRAYESTVQALYASGPLSWEQESLLTNLRLSLNISDEEHLLHLRSLLSSQVV